jgi:hypothetical protein
VIYLNSTSRLSGNLWHETVKAGNAFDSYGTVLIHFGITVLEEFRFRLKYR